ncbi:MAG: 3-oxo-tetronate kinase [Geminicoccaceae bacterium]
MALLLGAIADDFTGATDLANTLTKEGMRTVQLIGVPEDGRDAGDVDAVVIALKSRTAPVAQAVEQALAALDWLQAQGVEQVFFKYCSTFDSSARGNIGPVADALLAALDAPLAIVCPAFPTTRRTIYQGHLFVGDQLLSESPMKDHPLTPMRDASLLRLMAAQSRHAVRLVAYPDVADGVAATRAALRRIEAGSARYAVCDALMDQDLRTIGAAIAEHKLVTGGSGIALGLPDNFRRAGRLERTSAPFVPAQRGRAAVLAGSCSSATRGQIDHVLDHWPHWQISGDDLVDDSVLIARIAAWFAELDPARPALISSSADPAAVQALQARFGREEVGARIEAIMAGLAQNLVFEQGVDRLVVAGGETSGAVVSALKIKGLRTGIEIDPGVPWTASIDAPEIALALKSGNFGAADFFPKALAMLA